MMELSIINRLRVLFPVLSVAGILSVSIFYSCSTGTEIGCRNDVSTPCIPTTEPHDRLSEYHLYQGDLNDLKPVDGLLPYDLNTPLFSDYADKARLVYVPEGKSISYNESGVLNFPVGSLLVKTFYYDLDKRAVSTSRQILETRLLVRYEAGWTAETYVWNDEQDEAFVKQTGAAKEVIFTDEERVSNKVNYLIPTKNDCKSCHSQNNTLIPIGPKVSNLNKMFAYADGDENQLVRWEQAGILRDRPTLKEIPKAPVWDDSLTATIEERARIYLDVNCAHCHSPAGSATNSALFLSHEEQDPFRYGVCKPPVAAGAGSGALRFAIVPCKPEESILIFRMNSVEPEKRMPELGRTLIHKEGVELITEWIESQECTSCNGSQ